MAAQPLPADVKQTLKSPNTWYDHGYSFGHGVLEDGQPDYQKASYYNDIISDSSSKDSGLRERHFSHIG